MLVLHANWTNARLHLWGESLSAYLASERFHPGSQGSNGTAAATATRVHPFASTADDLNASLSSITVSVNPSLDPSNVTLRLPCDQHGPWPSDRLSRRAGAVEMPIDPWLTDVEIPSLALPIEATLDILHALDERGSDGSVDLDQSLRYWISVAQFTVELLHHQRFIPTLMQLRGDGLRAGWHPWLHDEETRRRLTLLLRAMPPSVRAAVDANEHRAWNILEDALRKFSDAFVRRTLRAESFHDALDGRDPLKDAHVAWLTGLLNETNQVSITGEAGMHLLRDATLWVNRLEDVGQNRPMRLMFKLIEPAENDSETIWKLSLHLQSPDDPHLVIDAAEVWHQAASATGFKQRLGVENPQELLLAELGRASSIFPRIESALEEKNPTHLALDTNDAYDFLREYKPLLEESGFGVAAPEWWDQPLGRLAARLHIEAPPTEQAANSFSGTSPAASMLGLNSLVKFNWQIAIGDQPLTNEEFRALAQNSDGAPLVRVHGRWVEINPEQLREAREFLERTPTGEMTLLEAIRLAHGGEPANGAPSRLQILGMDATGWVADLLNATGENARMPMLDQPSDFAGSLRPYQKTGLSWLAFLDRFGLGACLADDMGLGKTIQLIALLLHERTVANSESPTVVPPTLLIVPTSVIANWMRELTRFAPSLKTYIHHGPERHVGDLFVEKSLAHDVVITTYPLISRDIEFIKRVHWHRVALDEAQYIKNPPTKQTTAIRSLHAPHRLALTGTPVENRLSELWSIMEFCNPGYLGSSGEFRRRFGIPIERHRNRLQADNLRHMVRPFVLRRVKTDPKVIDDLPDLTETKEYATLTAEQAALYQKTVNAMLTDVDRSEGIQRRGLVLATLVKLKQICNHPAQAKVQSSKGQSPSDEAQHTESDLDFENVDLGLSTLSSRSGKAKRLMVMLEEVIASGEKALIFTQFRQMGHLLTAMIQSDLDCEALFLHGGTPASKRQHLIDRFQSDHGGAPIFVLSLKAGGLGLNLTAANHVFHYDRWWNPAVENQATDRAFRIGQMRAVQVHKFVCLGTLEERIDQMIEQKTELAQNIIGSGEQWLTELSTSQLHDLLMLRPTALESES